MSSIQSKQAMCMATVEVDTGGVSIHNAPTQDAPIIDRAQDGEALLALGKQGDWCCVRHGDKLGYVRCAHIVLHY